MFFFYDFGTWLSKNKNKKKKHPCFAYLSPLFHHFNSQKTALKLKKHFEKGLLLYLISKIRFRKNV